VQRQDLDSSSMRPYACQTDDFRCCGVGVGKGCRNMLTVRVVDGAGTAAGSQHFHPHQQACAAMATLHAAFGRGELSLTCCGVDGTVTRHLCIAGEHRATMLQQMLDQACDTATATRISMTWQLLHARDIGAAYICMLHYYSCWFVAFCAIWANRLCTQSQSGRWYRRIAPTMRSGDMFILNMAAQT
jgi:hypothetical protein